MGQDVQWKMEGKEESWDQYQPPWHIMGRVFVFHCHLVTIGQSESWSPQATLFGYP
jgi:hypothetical protein